jgi:hypothetical protein
MRRLAPVLLALATITPAFGAAQLTYSLPSGPRPVVWAQSAFPIRYQVDRRVASLVPGGASLIDEAFGAWAALPESNVAFQDSGVNDVKAGQDGRNTITVADELFRDQNYIALTTNWWDKDGHMTEADIEIDPMAANGKYNLQQLVEHEIGHFLGLDHSAVLSSVMFPYVGSGPTPPLDSDERLAIAAMYPKAEPALDSAILSGRVTGDSGGIFAAQVVAIDQDGRPVATALTNEQGEFVMRGVPAGVYRLYTEPLDGPVETRNLSGVYQTAQKTSFPTRFLGAAMRVESGKVYGNLALNTAGSARLNPIWIGTCGANGVDASLSSNAITVHSGQSISLAVAGEGFVSGMTTFEILNPGFHRTSDFRYAGNYVAANFIIDAKTQPGPAVILVSNSSSEQATLTGALRIQGAERMRVARR